MIITYVFTNASSAIVKITNKKIFLNIMAAKKKVAKKKAAPKKKAKAAPKKKAASKPKAR